MFCLVDKTTNSNVNNCETQSSRALKWEEMKNRHCRCFLLLLDCRCLQNKKIDEKNSLIKMLCTHEFNVILNSEWSVNSLPLAVAWFEPPSGWNSIEFFRSYSHFYSSSSISSIAVMDFSTKAKSLNTKEILSSTERNDRVHSSVIFQLKYMKLLRFRKFSF